MWLGDKQLWQLENHNGITIKPERLGDTLHSTRILDNNGYLYQIKIKKGPGLTRWVTMNYNGNDLISDRTYLGDLEISTYGPGEAVWFYYLDNGVVLRTTGGSEVTPYYLFTDHQGSVLSIYDDNGQKVFNSTYDAWGRQTVTKNDISFHRGYCGHEMLPDFGLINMNGRVYDPLLGRFLSPDPYVQDPLNPQCYNRYSYCLNNPVKYTDPSGELSLKKIKKISKRIGKEIWNGVKDFVRDPFTYTYHVAKNEIKLSYGLLFKGNKRQILSRFTFELFQTSLGILYSEYRIGLGQVDHIGYFDGATYVMGYGDSQWGVTIGSIINIQAKEWPQNENGRFDPTRNMLYMHEYGHYLQSQMMGPFYLFEVGLPSLGSAMKASVENGISSHDRKWYEINANRLAKRYFEEKYGVKIGMKYIILRD